MIIVLISKILLDKLTKRIWREIFLYRLVSKLMFYNNDQNSILNNLSEIFRNYELHRDDPNVKYETIHRINKQIEELITLAAYYGFEGDLWRAYLVYILVTSDNVFTRLAERSGSDLLTIDALVRKDLEIIMELVYYDFSEIEDELGIDSFSVIRDFMQVDECDRNFNRQAGMIIRELIYSIPENCSSDLLYTLLRSFYHKYGVGIFGLNKAFKISHDENEGKIVPITSFDDDISFDDLFGYESQKDKLIANTEAFIHKRKANNVLLYGDAGTGKSSSIKALLNRYYNDGLRIIQVYKHEMKYLSDLIAQIKDHHYFFIIYMDDLSFEENESEYKYLKALIEGGLEIKPYNILIYATSNRRHLIKESWDERADVTVDDDMYRSDTVREKLSLVDRFGITIGYYRPTMSTYKEIVVDIARRYPELDRMSDEELKSEADVWIRTHGNPSGRTAEQLVKYLLGNL